VPVILVTPEFDSVTDPPRETDPPPESPDPAETVMEDEARAEIGILLNVFDDPDIVLFVSVWAREANTKSSFADKVGIDAMYAPDPPVWVEIVVLDNLIWFDPDVNVKDAKEGADETSSG
jgi:hypothetical protein